MFGVLSRRWRHIAVGFVVALSLSSIPVVAEEPQITDPEQDAYAYPGPLNQLLPKPPNPLLSNDTADILAVTFAGTQPRHPGHDGAYTVSLRGRAEPNAAYVYLVGGQFAEDCFLFHTLRPGKAQDAFVICGDGEDFRIVGSIRGSAATVKDHTVTATFSFRRFALPGPLRKDPELDNLYAVTCPVTNDSGGCNNNAIDSAFADKKFKV